MSERTGLLLADDPWMARRLERVGREFGLVWVHQDPPEPPAVVVLDLAQDAALGQVRQVRERWPEAIVAGFLAVPDHERWLAGQRAGCDLVTNRGALVARLRPLLAADARDGGRLFPLLAEADLAGRLGLVTRVPDTPVGALAVYHIDGRVCVVSDVCPHAGATLSHGELDGGMVTCPAHGSQFDVRTGERVRGPADVELGTFRAVVTDGQVSIALDNGTVVRH